MRERSCAPDGGTVLADETLLDIVEHLHDDAGATVTEIANELGYAKSTVHNHLSTLYGRGYVLKDGTAYHLGLRFLAVGERTRNRYPASQLAKEKVDDLARETGERAQFIVEEHGDGVYLHRALGERAVRTDPGIGNRIPLHATAAGKAILANVSEERLFDIAERTAFEAITERTITDESALRDELEEIRERGYAFNDQENLDGLRAVGVPITGPNDEVIGALSVSGPNHRFKGESFERELPNLLLGTANELELNIAYS